MNDQSLFGRIALFLRSLSLRTRLLFILLLLLGLSITSLSVIYSRSEEILLEKVAENIDHITKAIQISVEQLAAKGDSTERLKNYVDMLNKKGIQEITIVGGDSNVIASSNPKKVGKREKINPSATKKKDKASIKKDLLITATIGDKNSTEDRRLYNVIMPVSVKGENIGYVLVSMALDDFRSFHQRNHLRRMMSTVFAFALGIVLSLVLAKRYTEPIKKIAKASKRIAQGDFVKIEETRRNDEIGVLVQSFNDMVTGLKERQELEERLQKSEQLSRLGQIASGIAHEVRNPLNFLSLSVGHIRSKIADENIKDRDEILSLLDNVTAEIYKVNELINNFLLLGKPVVLNREPVSPESLVADALYLLDGRVRDGIEIKVIDGGSTKALYCDRLYMRMCLTNLVLNAIQAIEGKGVIAVEFSQADASCRVSVADNGKGIRPEEMDKIFEPYYSTKTFGVGLGLTITKRLVEEHGGKISIESAVGKGTVATIEVPVHEG
jgi:nitrogen fixation/metabolism regulation signal transduction histidine kinase